MKTTDFEISMKSLAKTYKERAFRDGAWRYLSGDDFMKDVIRETLFHGTNNTINIPDCELYQAFRNFSYVATRYYREKIKDNQLTFEEFFTKELAQQWGFNFTSQSKRTYKILKFLDTLHPNKRLAFSVSYDENEDGVTEVNVKAIS